MSSCYWFLLLMFQLFHHLCWGWLISSNSACDAHASSELFFSFFQECGVVTEVGGGVCFLPLKIRLLGDNAGRLRRSSFFRLMEVSRVPRFGYYKGDIIIRTYHGLQHLSELLLAHGLAIRLLLEILESFRALGSWICLACFLDFANAYRADIIFAWRLFVRQTGLFVCFLYYLTRLCLASALPLLLLPGI